MSYSDHASMQPWRLDELNYGQVKANPPVRGCGLAPGGDRAPQPASAVRYRHISGRGDRRASLRHRATKRGLGCSQLPALPYGTETNQMKFPLAMNLNPTTLVRVITDLVDSLAAHGILRCVLLNGHGGNDLKWVLRELHVKHQCIFSSVIGIRLPPTYIRQYLTRRTTMPARWRRAWGWLISRAWSCWGRRTRVKSGEPVRGDQPRLGRDHASLASLDDQLGRGRPARRHRRQRGSRSQRWSPSESAGSSPSWPQARWTKHSRFRLATRSIATDKRTTFLGLWKNYMKLRNLCVATVICLTADAAAVGESLRRRRS